MQNLAPRDYTAGAGMPGDRGARLAARQAFVSLKVTFLQVLEHLHGAEWLRVQVLGAEEPVDLWLLRAPMFEALDGSDAEHRGRRQALRRALDAVFPDREPASGFVPF
jgi:hypothetical protein